MPRACKLLSAVLGTALALASLAPPATATEGSGGVLVVGDSLEELTSPYLRRYLPGVPLRIDAVGGYNSFQIYDLFERSYDPSQSVIVFDAGTNDNPAYPEILAGNLQKVSERIGDRCLVVPTIHGLIVDGVGNQGKNRVVRAFAASRPGTQTPNWAAVAVSRPELMQADDLHPTPSGADYRAQLIARGVRGCLAYAAGAAPPGGGRRAPQIESAPRLAPLHAMARRQAAQAEAIATALAAGAALRSAPGRLLAVAMLTMASSHA